VSNEGLILRRWEVNVSRYGQSVELATTRGKALSAIWRCDAFGGYSFGEFLKIARCRLSRHQPETVAITVLGKPAFYLGHNNQYVQFSYPGGEFVLNAHPFDVEPQQYRPRAYQRHEAA
jgi:hypothetical protein